MKRFVILISVCIFVILTGCSVESHKQTQSSTSSNNSSENGSNIIENYIDSRFSDVSGLSVEYSLELGTGLISVFRFYQNSEEYEGIARLNSESGTYTVEMEDHTKVDKSSPFTVHQLSGSYFDTEGNKKTYIVISGTVNNKQISEMNLFFNDGHLVDLIVGDNRVYSYVRTDKDISIKKVVALDDKQNEIFQYPPYPPKKI